MPKLFTVRSIFFVIICSLFLISEYEEAQAQTFIPQNFYQVTYREPYASAFSSKAILTGQFSDVDRYTVLNVFLRDPLTQNEYWAVKNMVQMECLGNVGTDIWMDLTELGHNSGEPLELVDMYFVLSDTFLLQPIEVLPTQWEPQDVRFFHHVTGNEITNIPDINLDPILPVPQNFDQIDPVWLRPSLPEFGKYEGCQFPNIDLDSSNHFPNSAEGYAGDKSAGMPAAYANSLDWLEAKYDQEIFSGLSRRQKLVQFSADMAREQNGGTSFLEAIAGALKTYDDLKLPVSMRYQSVMENMDIESPVAKYGHKAENENLNHDIPDAFPVDYEWVKNSVMADENVKLVFSFFKVSAGNTEFLGNHAADVSGVFSINNLNRLWVSHDMNQEFGGGLGLQHTQLTWSMYQNVPVIEEWSFGVVDNAQIICVVTGAIASAYDPKVQYLMYGTEVSQVSWVSPMDYPFSLGGAMNIGFFADEDLRFLNVVGKRIDDGMDEWIIQNFPIPPHPDQKDRRMTIPFDLGQLNAVDGMNVTDLELAVFYTKEHWPIQQTDFYHKYWDVYNINTQTIEFGKMLNEYPGPVDTEHGNFPEVVFTTSVNLRDSVVRDCRVPNIDLDSSANKSKPNGYTGDWDKCAPAATANSMQWLEKEHKEIKSGLTHRQKLEELSNLWDKYCKELGDSKWQEAFVKTKLAFADKHKLPIKIKFQGAEFDSTTNINSPDTTNGKGYGHYAHNKNAKKNGRPTWNWIKQELKDGEDVEMSYDYKGSDGKWHGHMVVLTGFLEAAGQKYLYIKDDCRQGGPGVRKADEDSTETGESQVRWEVSDKGIPKFTFRGATCLPNFAVSESYDKTVQFRVNEKRVDVGQSKISIAGVLNSDNSLSGMLTVDLHPGDSLKFANIVLTNFNTTVPELAVTNMPIPPSSTASTLSFGIDLENFTEDGVPLLLDEVKTYISDEPLTEIDLDEGAWNDVNSSEIDFHMRPGAVIDSALEARFDGGGKIKISNSLQQVSDFNYYGDQIYFPDLNEEVYNSTTIIDYNGDAAADGPAAAAAGLDWLEQHYEEIPNTLDFRDKITIVSLNMERQNQDPIKLSNFMNGMLQYIFHYRMQVSLNFQSSAHEKEEDFTRKDDLNGTNYVSTAVNDNPVDNSYPQWDWLTEQISNGASVTILYGYYDKYSGNRLWGNYATVTGTIAFGEHKGLWIKEDKNQYGSGYGLSANLTTSGEEFVYWHDNGGISVLDRRNLNPFNFEARVEAAIAANYDPTIQYSENQHMSAIRFDQLDFVYDMPTTGENSSYGAFSAIFNPNDELLYVNVMMRSAEFGNEYWGVRNMPLFSNSEKRILSYGFDLEKLGILDGEDIDSLDYDIGVSDTLWTYPHNVSNWIRVPVGVLEHVVANGSADTDGSLGETLASDEQFTPGSAPKDSLRRRNVPNLDLSSSQYPNDNKGCGPASAANSLQWLENVTDDIKTNDNLRKKYDKLSEAMGKTTNNGVTTENFIKGKVKVVQDEFMPIKVKYQSFRFKKDHKICTEGEETCAENKNGEDNAYPTWEWLKSELKNGEDVEIEYGIYKEVDGKQVRVGGHWVTVTGFIENGNTKRVLFKDDLVQDSAGYRTNRKASDGTPNKYEKGEEVATWGADADGKPLFKRWGKTNRVVESVVSESYDESLSWNPDNIEYFRLSDPKPSFNRDLFRISFVPPWKRTFINVVMREINGTETYWVGRNFVAEPTGTEPLPYLFWVNRDALPGKIKQQILLDTDMEYYVDITAVPWTEKQDITHWKPLEISEMNYNIGNSINDVNSTEIGFSAIPELAFEDNANAETYDRSNTLRILDLDNQNHPPDAIKNYAGDLSAAAPASVAASVLRIDEMTDHIDLQLPLRDIEYELSHSMNRDVEKGISTEWLLKGMLDFIDSNKIPIRSEFQSAMFGFENIESPNKLYGHFAENNNPTPTSFPSWQWFKESMDQEDAVAICVQWLDMELNVLSGHIFSPVGYSTAAGVKNIYIQDDIHQNIQSGTVYQQLTWNNLTDGRPIIDEWSDDNVICLITGVVRARFDSTVRFGLDVKELPESIAKLELGENPSDAGDIADVIVTVAKPGTYFLEIYSMSGHRVAVLADNYLGSGVHRFIWDGTDRSSLQVPSGAYFVVLKSSDGQSTAKMIRR